MIYPASFAISCANTATQGVGSAAAVTNAGFLPATAAAGSMLAELNAGYHSAANNTAVSAAAVATGAANNLLEKSSSVS